MTTYTVTHKQTGREVYRYSASLPIEWQGMEFATHDHTSEVEAVTDVIPRMYESRRLTKLAFVGRLGSDFATILTVSKQSVQVEMFVRMLDWATPDPDGTSVDLDGTILDGPTGRVEFAPTATQADQAPGTYYYDIQMVDGAGRKRTIALDKYVYQQDITK